MSSNIRPYVLVYGVSVYDIFGFAYQNYRTNDSNPGKVRVSFGGVCRNIAENLARMGIDTKFISVIGDDEKGKSILDYAKKIHLDMEDSLIVKGESTPTYMAILDELGEMRSAIADMKITDLVTEEFIDSKAELIENAEYMVLDIDNPAIVEYILEKYEGKTRFVLDPVSAAKAAKVKHLTGKFHTIKPNRNEAEVLCGFSIRSHEDIRKAGAYFKSLGVENVFISLDSEGMYYFNGSEEGIVKNQEVPVVNVTGAGDSCVAGICYGYMQGFSIEKTVEYAIAMSAITISHEDTIHPDMGHDLVEEYLEKNTCDVERF
ncbi:carbohydrate kinase family protein [[Clostridium] polysaccharolyticum]|uniref:Pseudouridine kinase n=1 Tax=[Clostridium] polysaccharolyticum TaxID=29364 RepID=A0A1I0CJD7_9FIRM|nr:carbohydrate kinase family protein [[Clostridium] polysaccharolyticum]SET19087.1 pseudouridine kinase [[Clostridium] polysaccharolyticum]